MKYADSHIVEIKEYKNWLIIKLLVPDSPKIKQLGSGILFSGFNYKDLHISREALTLLQDNINVGTDKKDPVMEIIAADRIWWASKNGIIIPPNELFHLYVLPQHTVCENNIDDELKKIILNSKNN